MKSSLLLLLCATAALAAPLPGNSADKSEELIRDAEDVALLGTAALPSAKKHRLRNLLCWKQNPSQQDSLAESTKREAFFQSIRELDETKEAFRWDRQMDCLELDASTRTAALEIAVQHEKVYPVELLAMGELNENDDLERLIEVAAKEHGNPKIIEALLREFGKKSLRSGQALLNACKGNFPEAVKLLMMQTDKKGRQIALVEADKDNNKDIVGILGKFKAEKYLEKQDARYIQC